MMCQALKKGVTQSEPREHFEIGKIARWNAMPYIMHSLFEIPPIGTIPFMSKLAVSGSRR